MMRGRFLAILFLALLAPLPARAGIYITDETPLLPVPTTLSPDRLDGIWFHLGDFRATPKFDLPPNPQSRRTYYQETLKRLRQREREGPLALAEQNDLGACLLRVQDIENARAILFQAERRSEGSALRFLILANLATAYHLLFEQAAGGRMPNVADARNFLDQAVKCQQQALALWPELYPGWSLKDGQFYRRAELFYLRLLEVRQEAFQLRLRDPSPGGGAFTQVDNLFPGVHFVGPSGKFEPGRIAWASWDRLPPDAIPIVVQLVFWLPGDDRLYWLLGELFNSHNQVREAYKIFDDLVYNRNLRSVQDLNNHKLILRDVVAGLDEWTKQYDRTIQVFAAFTPRFFTGAPGIGPAATDAVWPALALFEKQRIGQQQIALPVGPPPVSTPPPPPELPRGQREWGAIFVGFLVGVLFGVLGLLQIRQWRQRHADSLAQRRLTEG